MHDFIWNEQTRSGSDFGASIALAVRRKPQTLRSQHCRPEPLGQVRRCLRRLVVGRNRTNDGPQKSHAGWVGLECIRIEKGHRGPRLGAQKLDRYFCAVESTIKRRFGCNKTSTNFNAAPTLRFSTLINLRRVTRIPP